MRKNACGTARKGQFDAVERARGSAHLDGFPRAIVAVDAVVLWCNRRTSRSRLRCGRLWLAQALAAGHAREEALSGRLWAEGRPGDGERRAALDCRGVGTGIARRWGRADVCATRRPQGASRRRVGGGAGDGGARLGDLDLWGRCTCTCACTWCVCPAGACGAARGERRWGGGRQC